MICQRCIRSLISYRNWRTCNGMSTVAYKISEPHVADFLNNLEVQKTGAEQQFTKNQLDNVLKLKLQFERELQDVEELESMKRETNDKSMQELADMDIAKCRTIMKRLDESLVEMLLGKAQEDSCSSIILDVSCGVGGQEAMLFASEMFQMYLGFASHNRWQFNILDSEASDLGHHTASASSLLRCLGGIRHACGSVSGPGVYKLMKFEAGIHRVQRVPLTEKGGRMHTSTVSVVVLPEPESIDVVLESKDIVMEAMRSSGPGGQHANTTDSAVRVKHIPTGIAVESQKHRHQNQNREEAMKKLSAMLYQDKLDAQNNARRSERKLQVGSRNRSEKIRTYNFQQDRLTDHRTKQSFSRVRDIMKGTEQFNLVAQSLQKFDVDEKLREIVNSAGL